MTQAWKDHPANCTECPFLKEGTKGLAGICGYKHAGMKALYFPPGADHEVEIRTTCFDRVRPGPGEAQDPAGQMKAIREHFPKECGVNNLPEAQDPAKCIHMMGARCRISGKHCPGVCDQPGNDTRRVNKECKECAIAAQCENYPNGYPGGGQCPAFAKKVKEKKITMKLF